MQVYVGAALMVAWASALYSGCLRENTMRRNLVRNLLFVFAALLLIGVSLIAARMAVRADLNPRVTLTGQTVPLVQQAHLLQATDTNQQLQLSIGLKLRNPAELDNLLSAIYNPQSPQYHHYLTPEQFDQLFAPTPDQVQQVVAFLQSQGLTVTKIASDSLLIDATGSVGQVQQAFQTQINNYQSGDRTFYANATPPTIPASLGQIIVSVGGLDNSTRYRPLYQGFNTSRSQNPATALATPSGYGPKQLGDAYGATPLQGLGNGNLGDGQTVAVFELDGYQKSDVDQYLQNYNLGSPNITNVLVDGFDGSAGQGAIEVELDIEVVAALAPRANLVVYEGPNTTQGLNDTYNAIVSDTVNKPQITTISWGLCEASTGNAELDTLDGIFKKGAVQGISFFAASGDSGAYDCNDSNLAVDSPSDDPYVTGVGGTNLQITSSGNGYQYGSESVWSNPSDTQRSPKGAGGGGGISNRFTQPSWQTGQGTGNSNGKRQVPDVSADADPASGYAVYCTVSSSGCPSSGWITVGGTSAAAPFWAGSTALINQYLRSQGKGVVGYANPALYAVFNAQQAFPAFHDITTGNNLNYQATPGYDMASGIGTPNVYNLARDLANLSGTPTPTPSPTPSPTVTPTATPTSVPNPTPTATPIPPTPPPALIRNGGFESGPMAWQQSSSGGYELIDNTNSRNGLYSAYFCGYGSCDDRLWQTFTVPVNYTKLTITYWFYSDTTKSNRTCLDTFSSRLVTTSGTTLRNMHQSCNASATNGWVQQTFDVTADLASYKGKQVVLFFRGTNSPGFQVSDFFVDDVTVTAQ